MYDELVKSLRQCAEASCAGCKNDLVEIGCRGKLQREAADAIEELSHDYEKLAEDFNGAMELLHKRKKPRWIPVTERLPDVNVWVLCACRANIFCVMKWDGVDWYESPTHVYMSGFVTHWMPLPELPKEE